MFLLNRSTHRSLILLFSFVASFFLFFTFWWRTPSLGGNSNDGSLWLNRPGKGQSPSEAPGHPDIPSANASTPTGDKEESSGSKSWLSWPSKPSMEEETSDPDKIPQFFDCAKLPGAEDVFVIMKTGATELREKLPVHFSTTFKCTPQYAIYSDYEEEFMGHKIHDSLDQVSAGLKKENQDFILYREMQKKGPMGVNITEMTVDTAWSNGQVGNPAWKLDKWKFLPLVDKALDHSPNSTWYFFMEADTHVVWENLLMWLGRLDGKKPYYIGNQMAIGSDIFAYGGAGFIISNPAMLMVSKYRKEHLEEVENFTAAHWAGDCVLGKFLADAGVPLTWAWPLLQGEKPSELDYTQGNPRGRVWCRPVVSYHHMDASELTQMWGFQQQWFMNTKDTPLLHNDVFTHYTRPQIAKGLSEWDNLSEDSEEKLITHHTTHPSSDPLDPFAHDDDSDSPQSLAPIDPKHSLESCRDACLSKYDCFQYSFTPGVCRTGKVVRLGHANSSAPGGIWSGWINDRVALLEEALGKCEGEVPWIVPQEQKMHHPMEFAHMPPPDEHEGYEEAEASSEKPETHKTPSNTHVSETDYKGEKADAEQEKEIKEEEEMRHKEEIEWEKEHEQQGPDEPVKEISPEEEAKMRFEAEHKEELKWEAEHHESGSSP